MASSFIYSNPTHNALLSNPSIVQELYQWWVTASLINLSSTSLIPDRFVVKVRELLSNGQINTAVAERTYNATYAQASDPGNPGFIKINIYTGLITGIPYRIQIEDYKNNILGNTITIPSHTFSKPANNISWVSGGITVASTQYDLNPVTTYYDPLSGTMKTYTTSTATASTTTTASQELVFLNSAKTISLIPGKSYLTLTNSLSNSKISKYNLACKQFTALTLPGEELSIYTGVGGVTQLGNLYSSTKTYSFGTSISLSNLIGEEANQSAALGFCVDPVSGDGYYLVISTTSTASSNDKRSIRILRVKNNKTKSLVDSQSRPETTYDLVTGGTTYNIDIKVKYENNSVEIKAFINGFYITATDQTRIDTNPKGGGLYQIIPPSDYIGLMCLKGKAAFDYVYASDILLSQYNDSNYITNFYQGQFSNDLINTSYGDLIYVSNSNDDEIIKKPTSFDEFGTVVREIVVAKAKFDNPAYPMGWVIGNDIFAKVIGYKINNFGAEAYVLNNSSTTIALEDGNNFSFYIYGNYVGQSGTIEYLSNEVPENITPEPLVFESKWLQNLSDVSSLGSWIKEKVSVKSKVVTMKVFGNPLISVGDIITINYSYQGFNGTQKLIVTSVNHTYSEGLETTVICRTL